MKTNFLFNSIAIITVTSLLFVGACLQGNSMFISMTMAFWGCSIGGVIGVGIRQKKHIRTTQKLRRELLLFYGLAMVLSVIWYFMWNDGNIRWIGIVLISLISLIVIAIRNNIWNKITQ